MKQLSPYPHSILTSILFYTAIACISITYTNQSYATNKKLFSNEELHFLSSKKNVFKCTDPIWMPFEAINKKGQHIGIISDISKLLEKIIGQDFVLVKTKDWTESHEYLKQGKCDIITSDAITGQTKDYYTTTDPFLIYRTVFIMRSDIAMQITFDELRDVEIGFPKGYPTIELIGKKYPHANIVEVDSTDDGVLKVSRGELYAFVELLPVISYSIQKQGLTNLKVAGHINDVDIPIVMSVRSDQPLLLSIINKALSSISQEQKNQIYNEWVNIKYDNIYNYSLFFKILSGILILIIISNFWIRKNKLLKAEIVLSKERERIMQDMHDGVGGQLVSTLAMCDTKDMDISRIRESVHDCLHDLRMVIVSLDSSVSDLSTLLGIFRGRIQHQLNLSKIKLKWRVGNIEGSKELTPQICLHILRILQESITNVIKHSDADEVQLIAEIEGENIILEVRDNGSKLVQESQMGYGLTNMKKRAKMIGAELNIISTNKSTSIILSLPMF